MKSSAGFGLMDKFVPHTSLTLTALILTIAALAYPNEASAQTRSLPKAGFNNYSGAGGSLPNGSGVSLQEGADRPKGAPPEVYNPGEPSVGHKLVRWEPRFMPLRIYVSDGRKMAEESASVIKAQRPQELAGLLNQNPDLLLSLPQCKGWTPDMSTAVMQGIEQWREFQNEGLFSFEFVEDPALASIFVIWTDRFAGDESAGGVSTGALTTAVLYDANELHSKEASLGRQISGTPVVMEFVAAEPEKLQQRAAHEFGHALGIKEHSPYNQDMMCVNGIARLLSPSDKATIRWLYRQKTPLLMLPPIIHRNTAAAQQQQTQDAPSDGAEQTTQRPTGSYRMHVGGPARSTTGGDTPRIDDVPGSPPGEYKIRSGGTGTHREPSAYTPLNDRKAARPDSTETKKTKEKKNKHDKGSEPETQPIQNNDLPLNQPKPKASEGF